MPVVTDRIHWSLVLLARFLLVGILLVRFLGRRRLLLGSRAFALKNGQKLLDHTSVLLGWRLLRVRVG